MKDKSVERNCSTCKYYLPYDTNPICKKCIVVYVLSDNTDYEYLKWKKKEVEK